jgi:pimeloyl-ACP methyl ester carboxylesterase
LSTSRSSSRTSPGTGDWSVEPSDEGGFRTTTFVLIHGAGDSGWYWHLVEHELRALGHDPLAFDLPVERSPTISECADSVVQAAGVQTAPVAVVAQSFGSFVAPLVVERLPTRVLVLVAGMVPAPGEPPDLWWENTGYATAVRQQATIDGGLTGNDDPFVSFFHDVPRPLAEEAMRRERADGMIVGLDEPWPLDAWPAVPTRFVLCTEDRFFPPDFTRRVVAERLGIEPDEIEAGHCVALSRPAELAVMLDGYVSDARA